MPRHGWGATLELVLSEHPAYAARHDLTALGVARDDHRDHSCHANSRRHRPCVHDNHQQPGRHHLGLFGFCRRFHGRSTDHDPIESVARQRRARSFSVAVGGVLDATVQPGLASGTGVAYLITPQPLPANMTFNRETGELAFAAAPGQAGTYPFTITATNGSRAFVEPVTITVTQPQRAATAVSGQVVDESGNPLAGMPVAIGTATATTDAQGDFTLTGIGANPGPLSAGGSVATADGRLALSAPVAQLLGHAPYTSSGNVIATPLILPKVDWSATSFVRPVATQPLLQPPTRRFLVLRLSGRPGRRDAPGPPARSR